MASIRIDRLVVGYGAQPVLRDLSFQIEEGKLFTLLGPSGCGKTTLLRTIAGFNTIQSGSLHFGERDVTRLPAYQRDVGMVFQDYALFPDKSVFDNVAYGLRARKLDATRIKTTVGEHLERVGLSAMADRLPAALSGGQRQRVALARALAIRPSVLLMDEPLSNLDAKLRVQVRDTIADLQKAVGITTVMVTHDQEEALVMSDRIGLMKDGILEQTGTPEQLYASPGSAYVADFIGAANIIPVALVQAVDAGALAQLRVGNHTVQALAPKALVSGQAHLILRKEDLTLGRSGSGLTCTIERRLFLGARTVYKAILPTGDRVMIEQSSGHGEVSVGDTVGLNFDPQKARVLAV